MIIRPLELADLPVVYQMYDAAKLPYEMPNLAKMESVLVAEIDGEVKAAVGAERILQAYLWLADLPPGMKLYVIRRFHEELAKDLRAKGWNELNAFVPPSMAKAFGRKLVSMFRWCANWPSFCVRF